jgi:hypothetical protein
MSVARWLAAALCCAWLAFRWSPRGPTWFVYDDSFYYFTIARNLVHGFGSTFDRLHATNGYHPLWLLVCAIPYELGLDDERAASLLLSMGALGVGVSAVLGLRVMERHADRAGVPAWGKELAGVAFVAFVFSPYAFQRFANGLESTCVLVLFAVMVDRLDALGPRLFESARERWGISFLACGLFLSRTDAILLVPWLAAHALLHTRRLRPALELALAPAMIAVLYVSFNESVFGTAMQTSGEVKRAIPGAGGLLAAAAVGASPALPIAVLAKARPAVVKQTAAFLSATAPLLGYIGCVAAYYAFLQKLSWPWYYTGPILFVAIALTVGVTDLLAAPRLRIAGGALAVVVLALCPLALIVTGTKGAQGFVETHALAGRWLRGHTDEGAIFGSWDAGALGYFSHRRVINLDGEVGSPSYVAALAHGDPISWTRSQRFDYVVNVQDEEGADGRLRRTAADYLGSDRVEGSTVVRTWPFLYVGRTNRHPPGEHALAIVLLRLQDAQTAWDLQPHVQAP